MRQLRPILGTLLSAGSMPTILASIFGLPGHIDDAAQWLRWIRIVEDLNFGPLYYLLLFAATALGLVLLTYGWWMPRLRHWRGIDSEIDYAIQQARFMALTTVIQRQMEDCRPLIEGVEGYEVYVGKYQADYLELIGKLEALDVGYPLEYRNNPVWYQYLVNLDMLVETGKLAKARRNYSGFLPQG